VKLKVSCSFAFAKSYTGAHSVSGQFRCARYKCGIPVCKQSNLCCYDGFCTNLCCANDIVILTISLMSFLLKTLERLVDRFIRDDTLIKYPLNENQHAYMAGKSTDTALHVLV